VETVDVYLEAWLAHKKKHIKASTADGYGVVVRMINKRFTGVILSDLTRKDIRDWLDTIGRSNKRLANIQSVLQAALSDAVQDEVLEANSMAGWTYRIPEAPKETDEVDTRSGSEQTLVLDATANAAERNLFQFACWTGLRTSEIVAVRWGGH
jgi:integrase